MAPRGLHDSLAIRNEILPFMEKFAKGNPSWIFPGLNIDTNTASISPYVRVGGRKHLASGDYVEGTTAGFFGGIGLEFLRDRRVGIGMEISYDASEVELERVRHNDTEDVKPCELMVSVFVVF